MSTSQTPDPPGPNSSGTTEGADRTAPQRADLIPPGDGPLQVIGDFGEMLTAASGITLTAAVGNGGCGGTQPTVFGVLLECRLIPSHQTESDLRKHVFQACAIDHSAISPFKIND